MYLTEDLQKKWQPVLEHPELEAIKDPYKRAVTTLVLENQQQAMTQDAQALNETGPTNVTGSAIQNFDPVLISLVRRALPNLIAYDVAGVQPMTGPTGLIFAMRARFDSQSGDEAFFNEANTVFSGVNSSANPYGFQGTTASDVLNTFQNPTSGTTTSGIGMPTSTAETLGDSGGAAFKQMAFSIEKVTVTAESRALKAEYSLELAQDLKAIHGLDAETELSNILSTEILAEINREVIRTIYTTAYRGATNGTATAGTFDLDVDSNGRWSVEKFKGLLFQIEREANAIAQLTRRGRGNFIICSSDVASALAMAGVLDYAPALATGLNVDEASTTFAGILNGKYKVYVDPYAGGQNLNQAGNPSGSQFFTVGYKGTSAFDAGLFYCPYVPLQLVRAVDPGTFQPKIGFKTRYGLVANPMVDLDDGSSDVSLTANKNYYYRFVKVTNLM